MGTIPVLHSHGGMNPSACHPIWLLVTHTHIPYVSEHADTSMPCMSKLRSRDWDHLCLVWLQFVTISTISTLEQFLMTFQNILFFEFAEIPGSPLSGLFFFLSSCQTKPPVHALDKHHWASLFYLQAAQAGLGSVSLNVSSVLTINRHPYQSCK